VSEGDPTLTFALAVGAGVLAQVLAHHLRIPGIVLFLAAGVYLGPDMIGLVRPDALGDGLDTLVGLAVSVILFEGGLNLNADRLRRQATTIRRLVTLGAVVTAVGATLAARLLMGWGWPTALTFGTLVIVTGPTVIGPLVRRIRLTPRLRTILEAEGVLIDPIGAIIAVVTLEVVLASSPGTAAIGLLGIPTRLLVGFLAGVAGGFLIAFLLGRDGLIPEEVRNVFTLAMVLALYAVSEAILPETGILAAPVAGIVVGNAKARLDELMEFKEQVTAMLVAMLFVLLAADVRLADVFSLGWRGVATIAFLMFVVRPLGVALCTRGSDLTTKERAFIAWLGPRGIVAAAVASVFAQQLESAGLGQGLELRALVFLVIAVTVSVQGLSSGYLASALGLRRRSNSGYAIVGANALGRALGRALKDAGHEVVLIDSNPQESHAAEAAGLTVIYGNANDEHILERADVEGRRGVILVTGNGDANLLIANHVRRMARAPQRYVCVTRGRSGMASKQMKDEGLAVLFGRPIEIQLWLHALRAGDEISRWRLDRGDERAATELIREGSGVDGRVLALALQRGRATAPVHDGTVIRVGDIVSFVAAPDARANAWSRMAEAGWTRLQPEANPEPAPVATT
jgi:NhaP-type Na+/H+ or K+/H+ antiporter